jgi:hypothetical protein
MKKRMIALLSVSALVAAMAVAAPALSGTRICLLNHYQWNEGGAVMSVSPADPTVSGGWTTTLVDEGVAGYLTLRGGLSQYPIDQPMRVDLAAGTVTLEVSNEPIGSTSGTRSVTTGPITVTVDSTRTYYFMNEDWLLNNGPLADVQGTIDSDGSIDIEAGFGYYIVTARTTTTRSGSRVTTVSDTTRTFSPLMRNTRLQVPNGRHEYTDEKDGTPYSAEVYIRQSGDTVYVTNLYGFGWRDNVMLIEADGVLNFPGQAIRDISDANYPDGDGVWYNTTLNGDDAVMGNIGTASKDELLWGLTVPSDGDGLWWGYDDNMLYYTDGNKFVVPSGFLRGDVNDDGNVNIEDVTALIDYLLSSDASAVNLAASDCDLSGSVNIEDVTALIDYLLSGEWPN